MIVSSRRSLAAILLVAGIVLEPTRGAAVDKEKFCEAVRANIHVDDTIPAARLKEILIAAEPSRSPHGLIDRSCEMAKQHPLMYIGLEPYKDDDRAINTQVIIENGICKFVIVAIDGC